MSLFRRPDSPESDPAPGSDQEERRLVSDSDSDTENVARLVLIEPRTGPGSYQSGISMASYHRQTPGGGGPPVMVDRAGLLVLEEDEDSEWPTRAIPIPIPKAINQRGYAEEPRNTSLGGGGGDHDRMSRGRGREETDRLLGPGGNTMGGPGYYDGTLGPSVSIRSLSSQSALSVDAAALYGDDVEGTRGWLVLIAWLLGVALLLPYNVFINANAFWKLRLAGSPFADNFQG